MARADAGPVDEADATGCASSRRRSRPLPSGAGVTAQPPSVSSSNPVAWISAPFAVATHLVQEHAEALERRGRSRRRSTPRPAGRRRPRGRSASPGSRRSCRWRRSRCRAASACTRSRRPARGVADDVAAQERVLAQPEVAVLRAADAGVLRRVPVRVGQRPVVVLADGVRLDEHEVVAGLGVVGQLERQVRRLARRSGRSGRTCASAAGSRCPRAAAVMYHSPLGRVEGRAGLRLHRPVRAELRVVERREVGQQARRGDERPQRLLVAGRVERERRRPDRRPPPAAAWPRSSWIGR